MEFLNIGIPELLFILLLMLIVLGPQEMTKTARTAARGIRKLIQSPLWKDILKTRDEIQEIPTSLLREAGIDEINKELQKVNQKTQEQLNAPIILDPVDEPDEVIRPAADETSTEIATEFLQDEAQAEEPQDEDVELNHIHPIPPELRAPYRPPEGDNHNAS